MEEWLLGDLNLATIFVRVIVLTISCHFITGAMNSLRGWSK